MRIVLTVNFSPWSAYSGGGQRSTHELATALAERGHEVTAVYTRPPWERVRIPPGLPYEVAWAAFAGLRSRSGAPLRTLNAISVARRVYALLEPAARRPASGGVREPVVVHSQGEEGALMARVARRLRFAYVVTPRYPSYPPALLREPRAPWGRLRRAFVAPKYLALGPALRGADRWCPTSRFSARVVRTAYGLSEARCSIVPNGVTRVFLAARRRHDASGGPILFFGRLSRSKGPATLLDALARMDGVGERLRRPDAVIVGRGPEEPRLRRMAAASGLGARVRFAGWRRAEELAELLCGASMAVLPSREESFGNAMVEAMAAGTPLVTTRVGAVPEVVAQDVTGLLVRPDEPAALASAIRRLVADPRAAEAMGRAARAHVLERFSWETTARAFERVYADAWASR